MLLFSVGTQAVRRQRGIVPLRAVGVCRGAGDLLVVLVVLVVPQGHRQAQLDAAPRVPTVGALGLCQAVAGEKSTVAGLAQMRLPLRMKEFPM